MKGRALCISLGRERRGGGGWGHVCVWKLAARSHSQTDNAENPERGREKSRLQHPVSSRPVQGLFRAAAGHEGHCVRAPGEAGSPQLLRQPETEEQTQWTCKRSELVGQENTPN
ncbi:hypothetical protein chiPu_0011711 [Chiloscyllium punctatum]|uniref:Uncharacterized protein n=1 Tax=Chiloscyllium punctatum TaxID=137246 RepID=A0A401SSA8_CHIPU|nr:hypothetical protein [Chiloscyllium punctatum]